MFKLLGLHQAYLSHKFKRVSFFFVLLVLLVFFILSADGFVIISTCGNNFKIFEFFCFHCLLSNQAENVLLNGILIVFFVSLNLRMIINSFCSRPS